MEKYFSWGVNIIVNQTSIVIYFYYEFHVYDFQVTEKQCSFCFSRSRSGYDSSSGGESDNEYNVIACRGASNQSQNPNTTNASSNGQGKHINKGRWTKEEVINRKFHVTYSEIFKFEFFIYFYNYIYTTHAPLTQMLQTFSLL